MSSRRTLILVGAIAVGALAAFMILRYIGGVEDRANADNALVEVLVVSGDIPKGTPADDALASSKLTMGKRRRVDLPATAVLRPEDVRGLVAEADLSAGEVVTTSKFASSGSSTDSSFGQLAAGNVAITVSVDEAGSAGGLIKPGDYVNVLVSQDDPNDTTQSKVATLFQKVRVFAVGQNLGTPVAAPTDGDSSDAAAPADQPLSDKYTLEVSPEAAPMIAAAGAKKITLVAVPPDYQPRPILPGTVGDLPLPGDSGLTPYDGAPNASTVMAGR